MTELLCRLGYISTLEQIEPVIKITAWILRIARNPVGRLFHRLIAVVRELVLRDEDGRLSRINRGASSCQDKACHHQHGEGARDGDGKRPQAGAASPVVPGCDQK